MKYPRKIQFAPIVASIVLLSTPHAGATIKELIASSKRVLNEAFTSKTPLHVSDEQQAILDDLSKAADDVNGSKKSGIGGSGRPAANGSDDLKLEVFDSSTILEKYGTNLTDMAKLGKFDHIKANPEVVRDMIIRLINPDTPSITLTAEAGVGKTAAVQAFAKTLLGKTEKELKAEFEFIFKEYGDTLLELAKAANSKPENIAKMMNPDIDTLVKEFKEFEIIKMDAADFVSGTHYRGTEGEKIVKIIEAASTRKVMIFIDEIHQLDQSILDAMKSGLTSGNLRIIGATTTREFAESLGKDAAIVRRMPPYHIKVPGFEETLEIVKGVSKKLERDFLVRVQEGAAEAAVKFSKKYVPGLKWPNSALEALKLAMGNKSLIATSGTTGFNQAKAEFATLVSRHAQLQKQFKSNGGIAIKEEMDAIKKQLEKQTDELLIQQRLFEAQKPISESIRTAEKSLSKSIGEIKSLGNSRQSLRLELDRIGGEIEKVKAITNLSDEQKAVLTQLEKAFAETDQKIIKAGDQISKHRKNIELSELEIEKLIEQRAREFPEAMDYSYVSANDIIRELLIKAGMDPKLVSREMKDAISDITKQLEVSAKLSAQASKSVADVQLMSMLGGMRKNLDAPNIYLAAGSDAGVERFAEVLTKGLWGESREAIIVDMKKYGSRPQDVFGVEKSSFGEMKAGFVSELVNNKMLQTIVFKNIDNIQSEEILKYLEEILSKGKIEVQFGNETRLIDFTQTNIILTTQVLSDTSSEALEQISKQTGQVQTMSAIKSIETALGESYRGADIVEILRKSVQATIPVNGLKSDDAMELIGGYLKDMSKRFLNEQSVRYVFDDSVVNQIYRTADELKLNPKDLSIQDILNTVNNGDFLTILARARLDQGIVAGDKVTVQFINGQWVVKKIK